MPSHSDSTAPPANKGRRALGRGLDALLPVAETRRLREVAVDRIDPNPNQPRQTFDTQGLEDLCASIRAHGVVQPLVVASIGDDRYRIIVGERRWQAAKLAGLERIPVLIKDVSDREHLELALVENIQRQDLNPLEEAAAYQRLIADFGMTQTEVGVRVGKSRVTVANGLRLLGLPHEVKRAIAEARITEGHARALLGLADATTQVGMLQRVERDALSVRQTEDLVRSLSAPQKTSRPSRDKSADVVAVEDDLRRALGTKVSLHPTKRGGRIVIEYFSEDEFQGLYERLVGSG